MQEPIHRVLNGLSLLVITGQARQAADSIRRLEEQYEPAQVRDAFEHELRDIVRGLGVSDVRMEQGSLRCDVNVSLRPHGSEALGTRTEVKNLNSFKSVEAALEAEIERQAARVRDPRQRRAQRVLPVDPRARTAVACVEVLEVSEVREAERQG